MLSCKKYCTRDIYFCTRAHQYKPYFALAHQYASGYLLYWYFITDNNNGSFVQTLKIDEKLVMFPTHFLSLPPDLKQHALMMRKSILPAVLASSNRGDDACVSYSVSPYPQELHS